MTEIHGQQVIEYVPLQIAMPYHLRAAFPITAGSLKSPQDTADQNQKVMPSCGTSEWATQDH
jgi:hypothetical protein